MRKAAERMFARRVHVTLGWALLIGICASLNIAPPPQVQDEVIAMERSAVFPRSGPPKTAARIAPAKPLNQLPKKQRIVAWFTRYDEIRRDAQMTSTEKANAIKLWATSAVASDRDTADARAILTSMVVKYDRAQRELGALPQIPETRALHEGYMFYFKRAHNDFSRYLNTLETESTRAALVQMERGRQQLAEIDVRNKSLDRRLRRQYRITEFTS